MKASAHLGRIDRDNLKKVTRWIRNKILKYNEGGLSYLEDYRTGRDLDTRAYGYLNALGKYYGIALAEAFLSGFLSAVDPHEAVVEARSALPLMEGTVTHIMSRAPLLDTELAFQAISEVGDRVQDGDSPEEMVRVGNEYRGGLYLRDFSYSTASVLEQAANAVNDFLAWHETPYAVSFRPETNDYVPDLFQEVSRDELKRALRVTNEEIAQRTYYGPRTINLPDHPNFTILGWSNGSESWHILWGMIQPAVRQVMLRGGGTTTLDANYILIPVNPQVMMKILPELDPLPLYEFSLEAKAAGKYPHQDERTVRKVLRAIIDAEVPEEDPEERALYAIDMWEIFKKAKLGIPAAQAAVTQFFLSLEKPIMPYLRILENWMSER